MRAAGLGAAVVLAAAFAWRDDLAREEVWFVRLSWAALLTLIEELTNELAGRSYTRAR